jgi:gamma-glutamyltranspeptidase / glutathione hydrolase
MIRFTKRNLVKLGFSLLLALMTTSACVSVKSPAHVFESSFVKQAFGKSGMVVSAHPLATEVGLSVLRKGGNAIDAAVAVQLALAVVYPQAGNLGGGGFLVYSNKNGTDIATLDYRERAPIAARRDMYLDSMGRVIPELSQKGRLAAGVPGSVAGIWASHQKYGKLPWASLVQPAIDLAERGFKITEQEANNLNRERVHFLKYNPVPPIQFLREKWTVGQVLVQKDLAKTLKQIQNHGHLGFYAGRVAKKIVNDAQANGGLITQCDLTNYRPIWRKPLVFDYQDLQIISMPPPSSGGILLQQMLGMLSTQNVKAMGFHSVQSVHLMTEIERRAFADRAEHMADPDFWLVPQSQLTEPSYLLKRMENFDAARATESKTVAAGQFSSSEETTHLSIIDAEGNAVAVTTTLNDSYGSRAVVAGAGFILNNEMDDFSAKPGVPNLYGLVGSQANAIAPSKTMLSSMTPTIVLRNGTISMVVGTPGGSTIPTSVFQTIVNVYDFAKPLKEAVHGPRFHHQHLPDQLFMEKEALTSDVRATLTKMGHKLTERGPIGRVEAIMVLPDGRLEGVADMRGDDHAAGF